MPSLKPPYKEVSVKAITSEHKKLAVSGVIVSKNLDSISIDDGTGVITALIATELPINTFVRVAGFLLDYGNGYEIQAHFIQDLSTVNQKLYKKVKASL
ncbi:MAG TPA: hypothetical protein VJH95_02455 [Candidatus Nanoarchaeia archaeon]|nr:hypothetical protein [Candidatus Nanoarchaeia archaeon]